jgi:hypothetical protein
MGLARLIVVSVAVLAGADSAATTDSHCLTANATPATGIDTRIFDVDAGLPIPVYFDTGGWDFYGASDAEDVIRRAIDTWQVPPIRLVVVGPGDLDDQELPDLFGPDETPSITVGFKPLEQAGCSASRGFATATFSTSTTRKEFGSENRSEMQPCTAFAYYDPSWTTEICPGLHRCHWVRTLAHEIGHCLGLNHEGPGIMVGGTTELCTCGELTEVDLAQLRRIYPTPPPPHITNSRLLPMGRVGEPYAVQIDVIAGHPPNVWAIGVNPLGTPLSFQEGLTLSPTGLLSGVPTRSGANQGGAVAVTDAIGESHTKAFTLPVVEAAGTTVTTTSTSTSVTASTALVPVFECTTSTSTTLHFCTGFSHACDRMTCRGDLLDLDLRDLRPVRRRAARLRWLLGRGSFEIRYRRTPKGERRLDQALRAARKLERRMQRRRTSRRAGAALVESTIRQIADIRASIEVCRMAAYTPSE